MATPELLNNISHKDLQVQTHYSEAFGDNIASTLTFATEFANVQKEYPILFRKDTDTDKFQAVVLFGVEKDENLFLNHQNNDSGWFASYVPAMVARGPFMIGYQEQRDGAQVSTVPVVHIDTSHPRVGLHEGKPLFLPQGGNSPYLEHISAILKTIHEGMQVNNAMFAAFQDADLIEPISIDIDLINGEKIQMTGYYTISEEKLTQLSADTLYKLNQSGFLQGAFLVASSLTNIRKLIDMKNARVTAQG